MHIIPVVGLCLTNLYFIINKGIVLACNTEERGNMSPTTSEEQTGFVHEQKKDDPGQMIPMNPRIEISEFQPDNNLQLPLRITFTMKHVRHLGQTDSLRILEEQPQACEYCTNPGEEFVLAPVDQFLEAARIAAERFMHPPNGSTFFREGVMYVTIPIRVVHRHVSQAA